MAPRKMPKSPTRAAGRELVLMGDVRQAPIEVREEGRTFYPVVALWVRADDGYVVGQLIDEPGHPAQTLLAALLSPAPVPGQPELPALPSKVVLFDEGLATLVEPLVAPLGIKTVTAAPFEPFEQLFANLLAHLEESDRAGVTLDLPPEVLGPFLAAAERLWRAKPWKYLFDYPPLALVPDRGSGRPLFASVLGANKEVFGVALYSSLEDYETALMHGESMEEPLPGIVSPEALRAAATETLEAYRQRVYLLSFEPKEDMRPAYREQLEGNGWPRRLMTVPTLTAYGGGQKPGPLNRKEASAVALAVDALVTFCQRHRERLAGEVFPIRDTAEVSLAGKTSRVDVSIPGEDPSAPPATVYRFKVSLAWQKEVWRTVDIRSDQTLEDLHHAIQDAFDWDDDHLYAFFLSGKAWDASTEYVRPETRRPGERSSRVRLDRLGLRPRKRFLYIFDFGDGLRHEIRVEKVGLPPDGGDYPRIVEEHGEPPSQYYYTEGEDE